MAESGRLTRGLQDHGATGGHRRSDFAHRQNEREVPGRDGANDADRRLDDHVTLALDLIGNAAAVDATGLFGKPVQVIRRHRNFTFALGERLAVFESDCSGDLRPSAHEARPQPCEEGFRVRGQTNWRHSLNAFSAFTKAVVTCSSELTKLLRTPFRWKDR